MPSRYPYQTTISNHYLGKSKTIRAMSPGELSRLAQVQHAKWQDEENRVRERRELQEDRDAAIQEAEDETRDVQNQVKELREILSSSLRIRYLHNWEAHLDRREFPAFAFDRIKPDRNQIRISMLGPPPQLRATFPPRLESPHALEVLFPCMRSSREKRDDFARAQAQLDERKASAEYEQSLRLYASKENSVIEMFNREVHAYNAELEKHKQSYIAKRNAFLSEQQARNEAVAKFKAEFETQVPEAVETFARIATERSEYPEPVELNPEFRFDKQSATLIAGVWLPTPSEVPKVVEYKYVASRKEIREVEMKPKDFNQLYEDVIHQIAIRCVYEIFDADYTGKIEAVVFNGWVNGVDPKTGNDFTSCILSYEASREKFQNLDLNRINPKECVRGFKGISAGPLVMLAPVKPIMDLNREDDRFVESKEVLDNHRSEDNLALMEWENFEHLVRQLFEKEFSKTGCEVRVTQASRDRGVDAIAFDPDPIRGGKFVIQAKRYNMVVPVSAVRDLYGTMISEGAAKGILVTTSYYGRDSRDFAKDKPITLIDGQNLVHMFQKHGYNMHIELLPKGDPRRGI